MDSATWNERARQQQTTRRMLPADECLGGQNRTGAHVELGKVVQDERPGLDHVLQVQLDVVAKLALQQHLFGEDGYLVAACVLGVEHRLVGTAQQIRRGVAARDSQCHTDTHCAGEQFAADRNPLAQHGLQSVGECLCLVGRHGCGWDDHELISAEPRDQVGVAGLLMQPLGERPDEPVAGVMPQIVIDGLEPVEIEEQRRHRALTAGHKPLVEMRQQRPTVAQAGEVVVLGEIAKLPLGGDAPLKLSEEGGDRLQRSELRRGPLPIAELDEAQVFRWSDRRTPAEPRPSRWPGCAAPLRWSSDTPRWRVRDETPWVSSRTPTWQRPGRRSRSRSGPADPDREYPGAAATRRSAWTRGSNGRCGAGNSHRR